MPELPQQGRNVLKAQTIFLTLVMALGFAANGAPFPAAATSALVQQSLGVYFQPYGFKLPLAEDWSHQEDLKSPDENSGISALSVKFVSKKFPQLTMSLETDALRADTSVESYAKKWMRDYANYGFEVLGAKTFQNGKQKGLVVDLQHKKKGIQIRQTIYIRRKQAVTITCSGQSSNFTNEIPVCNEVAKQFQWIN